MKGGFKNHIAVFHNFTLLFKFYDVVFILIFMKHFLSVLLLKYFFFLLKVNTQRNIDKNIFLQLIANKKMNRGYHIPMIDLRKSKKVTAVLKLCTQFSLKKEQLEIFVYKLLLIKEGCVIYIGIIHD